MANQNKSIYLEVKDHSVSKEVFTLFYNKELDLLETSPQPDEDKLPEYYKSEDYISHTNAKRNLFEKLYHGVRFLALRRKLQLIESFELDSKTLLDVGCGTGDFLSLAENRGWDIVGVEPNKKARAIAQEKCTGDIKNIDALKKLEKNSYSVITLWHVLEHLPNLTEHVELFKSLLKPNGVLVIAVPNYKSYDANYYKNFWAAYDVPRHLWHFSKTSIQRLFEKEDLRIKKIKPLIFDAFYVSILSEKYKNSQLQMLLGAMIGLWSNLNAVFTKEYSSLIYVLQAK